MAEISTWDLDDEEFEAVRGLPPVERYEYFMERVLEHGTVWVLVRPSDDLVGLVEASDEGVTYMMVWPHERFADAERERDWAVYQAKPFTLEQWVEGVVSRLAEDGVHVGVFPIWDRGVWSMTAEDFRAELAHALGEGPT